MDQIPVARPAIGQEEISAVTDVLKSGMLASGDRVAEFESKFADFLWFEPCSRDKQRDCSTACRAPRCRYLPGRRGYRAGLFVRGHGLSCCHVRRETGLADVDEKTFTISPSRWRSKSPPGHGP